MQLCLCLKDGAPLTQEVGDRDCVMVFESEDDALSALLDAGDERAIVAAVETEIIVERLRSGGVEWLLYVSEDQEQGLLTVDALEGATNLTPEKEQEIVKREREAVVRRLMMEFAAEGKVEWDLDTDAYRFIPQE